MHTSIALLASIALVGALAAAAPAMAEQKGQKGQPTAGPTQPGGSAKGGPKSGITSDDDWEAPIKGRKGGAKATQK